ncbi:hypothetical protein [Chishuiella sp.]|uniref:hypothetical protein n=1 Tax=Chishuiella sp. TaxID=1969467 RepID=UPI0028AF0807|nr:hypothetical protein [Chishuiella sp.]
MDRINKLKNLQTKSLIDIVKNYKKYNYPIELKEEALRILDTRGISKESLQLSGNLSNYFYDEAMEEYKKYNFNSSLGFILFISSIILNYNISVLLSLIVYSIALLFIGLSFSNSRKISKLLDEEKRDNTMYLIILLLLSLVLYFVVYFFMKNQVKEKIFSKT